MYIYIYSNVLHTETHEVEEALHLHEAGGPIESVSRCGKNSAIPGYHSRFIPATEFGTDKVGDLPPGSPLSKQDVADIVGCHIPLVIRIHGSHISDERPDTREDGSPYLFANRKGKNVATVGSGWVRNVYGLFTNNCELCPSGRCKNGGSWTVWIGTARHVIFDEKEASQMKAVLFDDHDDGRDNVVLSGFEYKRAMTEADFSQLYHVTHDGALASRLTDLLNKRGEVRKRMIEKLKNHAGDITPVIAVIGHPHGRKKYLGLGQYVGQGHEYQDGGHFAVKYNAVTCAGCSGGLVLEMGRIVSPQKAYSGTEPFTQHPHSGATGQVELGISANWRLFF